MEEDWSAFKMFTGKSTRKRPLGRPKNKWDDSIKMDLKEIKNYILKISFTFLVYV